MTTWKEQLIIPDDMANQIDVFENQMELRRQGKIDEKVFAETRLRQGAYGQRYDNGQRHDGVRARTLEFPGGTKGPDTHWEAPGMQRIKIPYGGLNPEQLELLAELADDYADGILHVTTRQDIQLHYVHIDDTPDLMRRLASVDITTLEACGNSVRNVTACPLAGVCHTQAFDVTPYASAMAHYFLGHDDIQDLGRKFKIAFSGCEHEACGLAMLHDMGLLALTQIEDGRTVRGFRVYVGGGLGTVPHQAKVLAEFVREDEMMPLAQAVFRVFARLGEKRNRNRARIKFLVSQLGIDEFRRLVYEELETIPHDDQWNSYLATLDDFVEVPLQTAVPHHGVIPVNGIVNAADLAEGYAEWASTNVYQQRQVGYTAVTINLPLGDFTAEQAFRLADIARRYVGDAIRLTVEQNIILRWVAVADLPALYADLKAVGLGQPGAGTIVDITTCPGTDTCKLGIASSRGLAGELRTRLAAKNATLPTAVKELRVKISGCFNSCGQHHVADIGFFGNSRRRDSRTVPHFQVVLGGQWRENAGAYGLAVGAVPSKAVPDVLDALTSRYAAEREVQESFQDWVTRLGKKEVKAMLEPFTAVPDYAQNPQFYSDWGDPREFTIGDIGVGECAGEVVSLFSFEIAKAEGEAFDALIALDEKNYTEADAKAYRAMIMAARALVRNQFLDVGDDPNRIVQEFKTRFVDTQLFFDRYAKGKFARYLLDRHENPPVNSVATEDSVRKLVGETNLFIEACHSCDARLAGALAGGVSL